jgi:hypothetical protein
MDPRERPKGERAETRLLGLHLIELAIAAGWKPRECIEFARDAHEFVMSTLPEASTGLIVGSSELGKEIGRPREKEPQQQPGRPDWGPDSETRRNALQSLADQNRTLREAAKILGISHSLVVVTARRLKVSFHGRRGRKLHPAASKNIEAPAKPKNGTAAGALLNGAALKKSPVDQPGERSMKRRCPSCNQVFEAAKVTDYICDDCESSNYAGRRGSA